MLDTCEMKMMHLLLAVWFALFLVGGRGGLPVQPSGWYQIFNCTSLLETFQLIYTKKTHMRVIAVHWQKNPSWHTSLSSLQFLRRGHLSIFLKDTWLNRPQTLLKGWGSLSMHKQQTVMHHYSHNWRSFPNAKSSTLLLALHTIGVGGNSFPLCFIHAYLHPSTFFYLD